MSSVLFDYRDNASAERAGLVFGVSSVRLEMLRLMLGRGEVSAADLMKEFGLTRNGVRRHLKALEEQNVVLPRHATHPRGSGPITYWRADVDEVLTLVDEFSRYVLADARI